MSHFPTHVDFRQKVRFGCWCLQRLVVVPCLCEAKHFHTHLSPETAGHVVQFILFSCLQLSVIRPRCTSCALSSWKTYIPQNIVQIQTTAYFKEHICIYIWEWMFPIAAVKFLIPLKILYLVVRWRWSCKTASLGEAYDDSVSCET